jgi:hypothetical protein
LAGDAKHFVMRVSSCEPSSQLRNTDDSSLHWQPAARGISLRLPFLRTHSCTGGGGLYLIPGRWLCASLWLDDWRYLALLCFLAGAFHEPAPRPTIKPQQRRSRTFESCLILWIDSASAWSLQAQKNQTSDCRRTRHSLKFVCTAVYVGPSVNILNQFRRKPDRDGRIVTCGRPAWTPFLALFHRKFM